MRRKLTKTHYTHTMTLKRVDILDLALRGKSYDDLINLARNDTESGWVFETIVEFLTLSRCVSGLNYDTFFEGYSKKQYKLNNVTVFLNRSVNGQGNDDSDITLKIGETMHCVSVKYKNKFDPKEKGLTSINDPNIKKVYVCKEKKKVQNHKWHSSSENVKKMFLEIEKNGFLFDEKDIQAAFSIFQNRFRGETKEHVLTKIQSVYLKNPKKHICLRVHQKYALVQFIKNIGERYHLLEHHTRSGKSITLLMMAHEMIKNHGVRKVLIVTPVTATISQFEKTMSSYYEFSDIPCIKQSEFLSDWCYGIAICSIQFFKTGNEKCVEDIDMVISDEAHLGTRTELSKSKLFNYPNIKTVVFSSGTPGMTEKSFKINPFCVYNWTRIDSMFMKNGKFSYFHPDIRKLLSPLYDNDYSRVPSHHYLRGEFDTEEILKYNEKHGEHFGFSWKSLFSLKGEDLELALTEDGKELLCGFLNTLISNDRNAKTIMKRVVNLQVLNGSRTNNRLIIVYLPTHNKEARIDPLQKALKKFIEDNNLWSEYNVIYDNGLQNHNDTRWIETEIQKAKKGCVLLLGEKSTVGVTYEDCDVTIHLDNTKNFDTHRQKLSRAGTDAHDKTIFVTVDMNFQRSLKYVYDLAVETKNKFKKCKTLQSALSGLHTHNIFKMDEDKVSKKITMIEHFKNIVDEIMKTFEEKDILERIQIEDDLNMLSGEYKILIEKAVKELAGKNPELLSGEEDKEESEKEKKKKEKEKEKEEIIEVINKTQELFRTFLIPLSALVARKYNVDDGFSIENSRNEIMTILCEKDSGLKKSHVNIVRFTWIKMKKQNKEIVEKIHEIYKISDDETLRKRIAEHFIPTLEEKKGQAEVPTPVNLVDEMLDKVPENFWTSPKRVLEPCCGKGNFVLGIYDRFFNGLKQMYPNVKDRHRVIVEDCLWFCDISPLNVFITKELIRCHSGGLESPNTFVGDTLEKKWDFLFDAIIGNPPYNEDPTKTKDPHSKPVYQNWIMKLINLTEHLIFITPSKWFTSQFKPLVELRNFMSRANIKFIKHFPQDDVFKTVKIKGGVSYFHIDKRYNGVSTLNDIPFEIGKYDIILDTKFYNVMSQISPHLENNLSSIYISQGKFLNNKTENNLSANKNENEILCYVSKAKGLIKYINKEKILNEYNFWKVATPAAAYKGSSGFSDMYLLNKTEIHSRSYISFKVSNENEAKSLYSYMKCKLVHVLLSLRKQTHNLCNKNVFIWIPLVPLDRIWDNNQLYSYFNFDEEIQKFIDNIEIDGKYNVL